MAKEVNDDGALKPTFGHEKDRNNFRSCTWNRFWIGTHSETTKTMERKKSFESASTRDSFLVDAGGYHARSGFASSSSSTNEPSLFFRSVTTRGTFT